MFKSLITEEIIASSAATLNPCSILLIYFPKSNYHRGHGSDLSELNTLVFRFIACTLQQCFKFTNSAIIKYCNCWCANFNLKRMLCVRNQQISSWLMMAKGNMLTAMLEDNNKGFLISFYCQFITSFSLDSLGIYYKPSIYLSSFENKLLLVSFISKPLFQFYHFLCLFLYLKKKLHKEIMKSNRI